MYVHTHAHIHTHTPMHTYHTYHAYHISTCMYTYQKFWSWAKVEFLCLQAYNYYKSSYMLPKIGPGCHYDQRLDLHSKQWMQRDGSMLICTLFAQYMNNDIPLIVLFTYVPYSMWTPSKDNASWTPKLCPYSNKRCSYFGKNLLVCYFESFHYPFYTVVYILSLSNRLYHIFWQLVQAYPLVGRTASFQDRVWDVWPWGVVCWALRERERREQVWDY